MSRGKKRPKKRGRDGQAPPRNDRNVGPPVVAARTDSTGESAVVDVSLRLWQRVLREPIALGVATVIFFRPWRDGLTYPSFNTYYLWVIILLAALLGARLLLRGETIRFAVPVGLLGLYVLVALLTGLNTIQVDVTYRALLFWAGHFFLFLLCTNGLRSRLAIGIVLGAFVVSSMLNALWSIVHFNYMLPMMRERVQANPALLAQYFGVSELTAAIKHRLEVNRAFGTLLFPNALAAFMILGIPYLMGELWPTFIGWRTSLDADAENAGNTKSRQERLYLSSAVGVVTWLVTAVVALFVYPFILLIATGSDDWMAYTYRSIFFVGVIPIASGYFCGYVMRYYGLHALRMSLQAILIPVALFAQSIALWLTFSRGGYIALAAALAFALLLLIIASEPVRKKVPWLKLAAGAASAIILALAIHAAPGWAQPPAPSQAQATADERLPAVHIRSVPPEARPQQPPPMEVDVDGIDLSAKDLINPSSLYLRLTYWKVGWAMAKDHWWTGVGLGNFGTAYATYQYVGAGDSQAAHNGYLSALCETGIFGLLAFCSFWAYFCCFGALRIVREAILVNRLVLVGLYTGVVAFLVHSIVDFNFFNPALSSPAIFLAGVFFSRSALRGSNAAPAAATGGERSRLNKLIALPLLASIAVVMGAAWGVYRYDFAQAEGTTLGRLMNVGSKVTARQRSGMARYFLRDLHARPADSSDRQYRLLSDVQILIRDWDDIRSFGVIRVPEPGDPPSIRPLAQGEVAPLNTIVLIQDRDKARQVAVEWVERWIDRLKATNDYYPYRSQDASILYEWYDLLQNQAEPGSDAHTRYVMGCYKWAKAGVERSPQQAWFHEYYAKALFLRGNVEGFPTSEKYFREGIEEFREACRLYSIKPYYWRQLESALTKLGRAYAQTGREVEAQKLEAEAATARQRAEALRAELAAVRL